MRGKLVRILALLCMIAGMGLCSTDCAQAASASDISGATKAIVQAYKKGQTKVDVSAYHLYNTRDSSAISDMMTDILAKTTGLFYADQEFTKLVQPTTDQVQQIEIHYKKNFRKSDGSVDRAKIQKLQSQIDRKVNKIMRHVNRKMSTVEKALILHDYLVQNTSYYDGNAWYCTNEWGVLLKGKGNCQGYAKAYGVLLQKAGIPVKYIDSVSMAHMWNLVKISGKWYHIDVTWDDPLEPTTKKDQFGLVLHDNFLRSTSAMKASGYYGFQCQTKTGTKYDKKYWRQVNSAFVYRKGKWLYQTSDAIKQRSHLESGTAKTLYRAGGRAFVQVSSRYYYFINYNRVFLYDRKTNRIKLVYEGKNKNSGYTMTQLRYAGGRLTMRFVGNGKLKTIKRTVAKNGKLAA